MNNKSNTSVPMTGQEKREIQYLSATALRDLAWTSKLIERFLGEPDKLAVNRFHRSGPRIRLYEAARVAAVAQRDEVRSALEDAAPPRPKLSASAQLRANTARDQLNAWVESIPIKLPTMSLQEARARAIESYNAYQSGRSNREFARADSALEFLDRITVNFLRHCGTDYDELLTAMFGMVGTDDARVRLRCRIIEHIVATYPELAAAGDEQIRRSEFQSYWL